MIDKLITPVILGIDFLQKHGLTLNFSHSPVMISTMTHTASTGTTRDEATYILKPFWIAHQSVRKKYCVNIGLDNQEENIDDCTVPKFNQPIQIEFPQCANSTFDCVMKEYRELFRISLYSNQWSLVIGSFQFLSRIENLPMCLSVLSNACWVDRGTSILPEIDGQNPQRPAICLYIH